MSYEDILKQIGGWGRYQKWLCFLLALSAVPNGYFTMIMIFTSKTPKHRCRILEIDGPADNSTFQAKYNASGLEAFIPWNEKNDRYDRCSRYVFPNASTNNSVTSCDAGFVYDTIEGERTAVTEWDLVCQKANLKPQITSLYMSGVLVGSVISGVAADWFGRWKVIIYGTYFQFVFMMLNSLSTGPEMYATFMFFAGGCALINFVAVVVLGAELIDIKHRAFVETAIMNGFAIGYMILPLFSYFIVDWKMLLLATGLTGVIFIPYWWLIPESPRWLIIHKELGKAKDILRNIAKWNGLTVDIDTLVSDENMELISEKNKQISLEDASPRRRCCNGKRLPYVDLVTKPGMLIRTLCTCCSWWVISLTYYTMSLNTGNMGGDDIINCFISASVEIPAYTSVYLFLRNRGRRWLMVVYMFLSSIMCLVTPFLGKWNATAAVVSAMLGKFCVTSAFSLVYLYTAELFPTAARNQAMGATSVCARVGSVIAPYIIFLGDQVGRDLPYLIIAFLAFLASSLNILLPETQGMPLPDTFEEANMLKRQPFFTLRRRNEHTGQKKPSLGST